MEVWSRVSGACSCMAEVGFRPRSPQLRAQIMQNLSHLKPPPGVGFHERPPDAIKEEDLATLDRQASWLFPVALRTVPLVPGKVLQRRGAPLQGAAGRGALQASQRIQSWTALTRGTA